MAKATLPTNFKDDILASSMGSKRRYNVINNPDGTISLEDVTTYTQVGSTFGAAQINATNKAANAAADASKIIDDYDTLMANTQAGYMAGALAVKELNSNLNKVKFGEITLQSTSQKIELGYKPKYIMISCKTATGSASNATSYAENNDGTVNFFTSSGTTTFPNSTTHTINSVDDTGFVVGAFTNPNITKVYFLAGK